jgi:hypothetical protein
MEITKEESKLGFSSLVKAAGSEKVSRAIDNECRVRTHKRFSLEKLTSLPIDKQEEIGSAAVLTFRRHCQRTGTIDIDELKKWMEDHPTLLIIGIIVKCGIGIILLCCI